MPKPDPSFFEESTEDVDLADLMEVEALPRDLLAASALSAQLGVRRSSMPPPFYETDFDAEPSLTGAHLSWHNGQVVTRVSFRARWRRFLQWIRQVGAAARRRVSELIAMLPARRRTQARVRMLTPKP